MQDTKILYQKACEVRKNAYAPYSNFLVGSCLETETGKLFVGCNVENAAYSVAVCSEGNAVGAMIAGGERKIKQIAIVVEGPGVAAPCGACRQRLHEFGDPTTIVHLFDLHGSYKQYTVQELIPYAFGADSLSHKD